jgi:glutamine---fructose-6-phosphate transaminase (isomerizing)
MNAYQSDILAQPGALRDTLEGLAGQGLPAEYKAGLQAGRWKRVLLTGMGSSYFALLPLQLRLLEAGYSAWLVETSEMIYSKAYLHPGSLVIAASQSGASAEILRLLDAVGPEVPVVAITNTPDSPLGRRAAHAVRTQAGVESNVSCKTYVASLAAQAWLGDQLLDGPGCFAYLDGVDARVQAYLDHWQAHVAELKGLLAGVKQVYLAGRGTSVAAAGTGGLTTKESTHVPAEGMSSAAFRHGPFEMVGPETFVLAFAGCGDTVGLNRKLAADVVRAGGRAGLVERGGSGVFGLPVCADAALPILEILPVQMQTLALSELHGHSAGVFGLGSKVTTEE